MKERLEDINEQLKIHNTRRMYELIGWERRGFQPKVTQHKKQNRKDADGERRDSKPLDRLF